MQLIKIYIAAPFDQKERVRSIAADFHTKERFRVTSRWYTLAEPYPEEFICAGMDLVDIDEADVVLFLADNGPSTQGGMYVELGYALATKPGRVIWVGEKTNVFTYVKSIAHYNDFSIKTEVMIKNRIYSMAEGGR